MCIRDRLETVYKIISSTLAARLKSVLDNLLGHEQKAYMPRHFIAECTQNTYDIFTHAKNKNLPGMLLLRNFEKAFDLVSLSSSWPLWIFFDLGEFQNMDNYTFGDEGGEQF